MQLLQERTEEEQENENQNYIESVISDVGISEIPTDLLNAKEEMEWFISNNIIKANATYDEEVIADLEAILMDSKVLKLFDKLFWLVNFIKFRPNRLDVIQNLRIKVSKYYGIIMTKMRKLTEEEATLLKLVTAYLIHSVHYKLFPFERRTFDVRFILDCYHIVFYEMTGVLVSDFFIHSQIEKVF